MDTAIFWAKWSRHGDSPSYHPLLYHLIDVSAVTLALWEQVLPLAMRTNLSKQMGLEPDEAARWVAFWAGLHDLGKASPAFQLQLGLPLVRQRLVGEGLPCPPTEWESHGAISALALPDLLERYGLSSRLARTVAVAVGGHHGTFPTHAELDMLPLSGAGEGLWEEARAALTQQLHDVLEVGPPPTRNLDNAEAITLAGLVSVADWIGSNETYFKHWAHDASQVPNVDPAAYLAVARERAQDALEQLGWTGWSASGESMAFSDIFPFEPRTLQQRVIELMPRLSSPCLLLVEAPMGEGKTEAAMYFADYMGTQGQRGTYFALPTQATSNQMFNRVKGFLSRRYPTERVNLQLVHGQSAISSRLEEIYEPSGVYGDGEGDFAGVRAAEWFTNRKRALLAPFGVGTVDQAMLAALQTRHGFVRLFGMGAKTVIIDEVHAYDTYMTTIIARLVEWLAALGSSVAILSATLPSEKRAQLLAAYAKGARWPEPDVQFAAYPRLTWLSASSAGAEHFEAAVTKDIHLRWVPDDALVKQLREATREGGCVAVICNTVARAQELYLRLRPVLGDDVDLLHARFLQKDRSEREERTIEAFGTPGVRPPRRILVSTQIIEQSLDIDFDLMVSDLAPVDLLLQRAGRLHRHEANDALRPDALRQPELWVRKPAVVDGVPQFDRDSEYVYEPHILLRTWLALLGRKVIHIPDDVDALIEAVYGPEPDVPPALEVQWGETLREMQRGAEREEQEAGQRYIRRPGFRGPLYQVLGEPRTEDEPELHSQHQALTRLGEPTVSVVCLTPAEAARVKLSTRPDAELTRWLLMRSVGLSRRDIVSALLEQEVPLGWSRSPLLRRHRLIVLDDRGEARVGNAVLRLDPELGVVIQ